MGLLSDRIMSQRKTITEFLPLRDYMLLKKLLKEKVKEKRKCNKETCSNNMMCIALAYISLNNSLFCIIFRVDLYNIVEK